MSRDPLSSEEARTERYGSGETGLWGLPGDLVVAICYTAFVWGLIVVSAVSSPIRVPLGLPLVVFLPGYALLAALFPGRPSRNAGQLGSLSGLSKRFDDVRSIQQRGVQPGERAALSFALSLFVVPATALAVDLVPGWSFSTVPITTALSGFVVVVSAIGAIRRLRLPREQRFSFPVGRWSDDLLAGVSGSLTDALLNAVVILSVLACISTLTFAIAVPNPGSQGTTLGVTTAGANGPVAYGFPDNVTAGEDVSTQVSVTNRQGRTMNYSVAVQLQRTRGGNVSERRTIDRFSRSGIPDGSVWRVNRTITPPTGGLTGENLRMAFYVYSGSPPAGTLDGSGAIQENYYHLNVTGS